MFNWKSTGGALGWHHRGYLERILVCHLVWLSKPQHNHKPNIPFRSGLWHPSPALDVLSYIYMCLTWTSCNIGNEPALTSDNLLDDSSNRHTTWLVAGQYHLTTKIYRVHNTRDVFRCRMVHVSALRMVTYLFLTFLAEGSLEVKLPTIWTDEKQRWEESEKRRRKKIREEKEREERRCRCAKR